MAVPNSQASSGTRGPLVEINHNIVQSSSSKQTHHSKIESEEQHDTNPTSEPRHSTAPEPRSPIGDNGGAAAMDLKETTHLISSPYPDFANQLRLEGLDTPFRLFAFALSILRPVREDYATAPYLDSFNWPEVFALLRSLCRESGHRWKEFGFYVVIFRSKLLESADRERLGLLDQKSHEEACASGGLLKYWFGSTDEERRNLATCLWQHREDASRGGGGPWHAQARASARVMYETITFHTHKLIVADDAESWRMSEYT